MHLDCCQILVRVPDSAICRATLIFSRTRLVFPLHKGPYGGESRIGTAELRQIPSSQQRTASLRGTDHNLVVHSCKEPDDKSNKFGRESTGTCVEMRRFEKPGSLAMQLSPDRYHPSPISCRIGTYTPYNNCSVARGRSFPVHWSTLCCHL